MSAELVRFARDTVWPEFVAGQLRAFDQRFELGPGKLRMDAAAHTAIGAGDHVFTADQLGVMHDAIGYQPGCSTTLLA